MNSITLQNIQYQGNPCLCPTINAVEAEVECHSSSVQFSRSVVSDSLQPHGILQVRILEWVAIPFSRRIFPTQGLNSGLLHGRQILYHLSHQLPKPCWIMIVRVNIFVSFLILEEYFQVFTIKNGVCCGPVVYGHYYIEVDALYAHFLKSFFYHTGVLNFVRNIFCIYWDDHMVFI